MDGLTACIFNIQKYSIHDGPGIRTVVFFKGCPLQCSWCSNPESQYGKPQLTVDEGNKPTVIGEYRTLDYIMKEVMKDKDFYLESKGGVTLSGGEVLQQHEFAITLLKRLKKQGIHTALETTGYTDPMVFQKLIANVDLLLFDIKHYDNKIHYEVTKVYNEKIIFNLKAAID